MINVAYFLVLFLVFLRITSYFIAVEIFFPTGTPQILKGTFSLILSFGIISGIDYGAITSIDNNYLIAFYAISEIMTGLILGYITNLVFQVVKLAGAWMDIHAGFSMVSILDPTNHTTSTLLGNFSYFISLAFFFIIDGHHVVINMLVESTKIVPIGKTIVYQETLMEVMQTIFNYFTLGIKMALPLVLIVIITDLALGLISRTVPTIPVMVFGVPIKNLLSIITYILLLPLILKLVGMAIYNLPNIFWEIVKLIPVAPLVLIFSGDDKTEEATPKRKSDSRKKGQIPRSKEVSVAITMIVCTMLINGLWGMMTNGFKEVIIYYLSFPMLNSFDEKAVFSIITTVAMKVAAILLPFLFAIMVGGIVASLMQTGFLITKDPLKPSFGKLNPLKGMKNLFSKRSWINLGKNIIVILIVGYIAYGYISENYQSILGITNLYLPALTEEVKKLVVGVFKQICLVLVIIAAIDYFLQIRMHNKEMRMTKQEVKDEYKQSEGDPKIKGKIKQRQREIGMKRMMQSVADATVIITNPTHLAIALKYEEDGSMEAPKVVGKGADYIALKMKTIAKENRVPIVENKPLARMMYDRVEVDQDIPQDLYQGVAEILAVIMKLKK